MKAILTTAEITTAYGRGIEATWRGIMAGQSALAPSQRIHYPSGNPQTAVGVVPGIAPGTPAVLQMLEPLLREIRPAVPADTFILLASTLGEIERLEESILAQGSLAQCKESDLSCLLKKVCTLCGTQRGGMVISAACASSTLAVARAAAIIEAGTHTSVLVVSCDPVSEFVYAGFATVNALAPAGAHPFDRNRQGLNLGEAAAALLIMSATRVQSEGRPALCAIAGWGATNDASHITRPDTTGAPLAKAIRQAIEGSGSAPSEIAFIAAHGTGTLYNDAMEIAAFERVLSPRPAFSLKGGLGHTLGTAGALNLMVALRAIQESVLPPTVGLQTPDPHAAAWVSASPVKLQEPHTALITNSGFGGINVALVVTRPDRPRRAISHSAASGYSGAGIGWITERAYGRVLRGETCSYQSRTTPHLVGSLDALFAHKIASFGRFDPVSRMTCYACALALADAGIAYSPEAEQPIGILGAGFSGSLEANFAYFKDYAENGRILARGNLFVYTLPSAPLGEAAIHFSFKGPLFAIIEAHTPFATGLKEARAIVQAGEAPAMLVVQAQPDAALAALITPDSNTAVERLTALSAAHPQLNTLIATLQENHVLCA